MDLNSIYLDHQEEERTRRNMDWIRSLAGPEQVGKGASEQEQRGAPLIILRAWGRGLAGLGEDAGGIAGFLGSLTGVNFLKDQGKMISEFWKKQQEKIPAQYQGSLWESNSKLAYISERAMEQLPGFAAFLIPSLGAGRAISIAGKLLPFSSELIGRLASIGSKIASPAMFGSMDLSSVYNEVRSRGANDSDAVEAATLAGLAGAAVGAINLHYLLGKGPARLLTRFGRGAASTSILSFLDGGAKAVLLGDDVIQSLKQSLNSVPSMALLGGAAGALLAPKITPAERPKAPEQALGVEIPPEQETLGVRPKPFELRDDEKARAQATQRAGTAATEILGDYYPPEEVTTMVDRFFKDRQPIQIPALDRDSMTAMARDLLKRSDQLEGEAYDAKIPWMRKNILSESRGLRSMASQILEGPKGQDQQVTVTPLPEAPVPEAASQEGESQPSTETTRTQILDPKSHPDYKTLVEILADKKQGLGMKRSEARRLAEETIRNASPEDDLKSLFQKTVRPYAERISPETKAKERTAGAPQILPSPTLPPEEGPPPEEPSAPQEETSPKTVPTEKGPDISGYWPGFKYLDADEEGRARQVMDMVQADAEEERQAQRRGTRGKEVTEAAAQEAIVSKTMTIPKILDSKPGDIWNAEESRAAANLVYTAEKRYLILAEMALKNDDPIASDMAKQALGLFQRMFVNVSAVSSEIGRALQAQQIPSTPEEMARMMADFGPVPIGGAVDVSGPIDPEVLYRKSQSWGPDTPDRFQFEQSLGLPSEKQQNRLMGYWARFGKPSFEYFYNALLTPLTALKIAASISYVGWPIALKPIARALGETPLHRTVSPDRIGEAEKVLSGAEGAAWKGLSEGVLDSWKAIREMAFASLKVAKAEGIISGLRKAESDVTALSTRFPEVKFWQPASEQITAENLGVDPINPLGRFLDTIGPLVRIPTSMVQAAHVFVKAANFRMGAYEKAHELAVLQGKTGGDYETEVNRLVSQLPPEVHDYAQKTADKMSFTKQFESPVFRSFEKALTAHPAMRFFVAPFVHIPFNLLEAGLEITPLTQNLVGHWFRDVRAGGAARDLALAKMALGWGSMLAGYTLAQQGFITGSGPQDPAQRRLWQENGWKPKHIGIPGVFMVDYSWLEPWSTPLSVYGDLPYIINRIPDTDMVKLGWGLALSIGQNSMTKSYFENFSDIVQFFSVPSSESRLRALMNRLSVPIPMQQTLGLIRRETDPYLREARGMLDRTMNKIPGLSDQFPPVRNSITGEPVMASEPWITEWLSNFRTSTPRADSVLDEIIKQGGAGIRAVPWVMGGKNPPILEMAPTARAPGVELTPRQRDRWITIMTQELKPAGDNLHSSLKQLIESDYYKSLQDGPDGEKANLLHRVYQQYRQAAWETLLGEDKNLAGRIQGLQQQRMIRRMPAAEATSRAAPAFQ